MAGNLPAIRAVQGAVLGLWNFVGIPTSHLSPQCIANYPEFSAIKLSLNLYLDLPIIEVVTPANW